MNSEIFHIPYTIAFLIKDGRVLMLRRKKNPWLNRWNGVGGKIEPDETPMDSLYREVMEETEVDLEKALHVQYAGIVTWDWKDKPKDESVLGMHAYLAFLSSDQSIWEDERETREGPLAWKYLEEVCNQDNKTIAHNVPLFLPHMIMEERPHRYHCVMEGETMLDLQKLSYPEKI